MRGEACGLIAGLPSPFPRAVLVIKNQRNIPRRFRLYPVLFHDSK